MKALPRPDEDRACSTNTWPRSRSPARTTARWPTPPGRGTRRPSRQKLNALAASPAPGLARRYGMTQCATSPATYPVDFAWAIRRAFLGIA